MTSDLATLRARKDQHFARDHHSPLTPEQKRDFTGLRYFPENPALRLDLPIEPFAEQATVVRKSHTEYCQVTAKPVDNSGNQRNGWTARSHWYIV